MKKLYLILLIAVLLLTGCSSNNEESKSEETKKIESHTPMEVQNLLIDYGFKETNTSGTTFYQFKDGENEYSFIFTPSPSEDGYSFSFGYGNTSYVEAPTSSFVAVHLSKDTRCIYDVNAEKLEEEQESVCDESVIVTSKEVIEKMNYFLEIIGISKEDLINYAKQCSTDFYANSQKNISSLDIANELSTADEFHELNYVIDSDWILYNEEDDIKSYAYLSEEKNEVSSQFIVTCVENENQIQAEDLYSYVNMSNIFDENGEMTYENQSIIINENNLKIVRYNMMSSENPIIYVAADIVTDQYIYTLCIAGEDYLKDSLNELFDSLINLITLNNS